jgi:hypothetical protein
MQKVVQRLENPAPPRIGFKEKRHQPSAEGNAAIGVLLTGNAGSEAALAPYRLFFPAQPLSCEGAIA